MFTYIKILLHIIVVSLHSYVVLCLQLEKWTHTSSAAVPPRFSQQRNSCIYARISWVSHTVTCHLSMCTVKVEIKPYHQSHADANKYNSLVTVAELSSLWLYRTVTTQNCFLHNHFSLVHKSYLCHAFYSVFVGKIKAVQKCKMLYFQTTNILERLISKNKFDIVDNLLMLTSIFVHFTNDLSDLGINSVKNIITNTVIYNA